MNTQVSLDGVDGDQGAQGLFKVLLALHRGYQTLAPAGTSTPATLFNAQGQSALAEALAELFNDKAPLHDRRAPLPGDFFRH